MTEVLLKAGLSQAEYDEKIYKQYKGVPISRLTDEIKEACLRHYRRIHSRPSR
jgi:hypothetical protein